MTVIKRNQIIAMSVAVMIIAAGYLNYTYRGKDPFSQEITGNMGDKLSSEKLGEATLASADDSAEIGQAAPASSANFVQDSSIQTSAGQRNNTVETPVVSAQKPEDYFEEARLERERVRDEETEIFEKIISNRAASSEVQTKAHSELSALSQKWEKEMIIERLIKAKGFKDVIVFINDKSANVVVLNGGNLSSAQAAQIQDIVMREAGVAPENIKIICK